MADFTTLLNRGHRRFIDKCLKKRDFGRCETCDCRALLVTGEQRDGGDIIRWRLCERCYDRFTKEDDET